MAKADTAPKFVIGKTTTLTATEDKYHDEVAALIAADEQLSDTEREQGVHSTLTLQFPTAPTYRNRRNKDTGETEQIETDTVARYKRYFQDSAKNQGKTAREISSEPAGGDAVLVTFVLTDLVKRPRKPKAADEVEAPAPVPVDASFAA